MKYLAVLLLVLTACGGGSTAVSAQSVVDKLKAAGLDIQDVKPGERAEGTPLPNSYKENLTFALPEVAPNGGQVFVCDTKKNCDALYAYFDALKGLAGPYIYQSKEGRVVVQMNSGLPPETGTKVEQIVSTLP